MDILMDSFLMDMRHDDDTGPAPRDVHERGSLPVTGR